MLWGLFSLFFFARCETLLKTQHWLALTLFFLRMLNSLEPAERLEFNSLAPAELLEFKVIRLSLLFLVSNRVELLFSIHVI